MCRRSMVPVLVQLGPLALYSWRGDSLAADPARMDEHVRTLLGKALAEVDDDRIDLDRRDRPCAVSERRCYVVP